MKFANLYASRVIILQKDKFSATQPNYQITPDGDYDILLWKNQLHLRKLIEPLRAKDRGLLILYGETFTLAKSDLPAILIHHGIGNDGTFDTPNRSDPLLFAADLRRYFLSFKHAYHALSLYRRFSKVVCVDTNVINQFRYAHPMYDPSEHLVYVPNWGDILDFKIVQEKWDNIDSPLIVLFARRFNFVRGAELWHNCLISLAKKHPNVIFRCVGYGPYDKPFKEIASELPNVTVEANQFSSMTEEYKCAHISVVPSLWSEGTSLTAIESMAAGCTLVVSNVGGLGNIVFPGVNGLIVPPTVETISEAVSNLIQDRHIAREMGLMGYKIASMGFSRKAWEKRMLEVCQEAIYNPIADFPKRRIKWK